MGIADSLLIAGGVGVGAGALAWALFRERLGWRDWIGGSILAAIAVNILLGRTHDWTLGSAAFMTLLVVASLGAVLWRWGSIDRAADVDAERRRAHYRDYPFNQRKPDDLDAPPD